MIEKVNVSGLSSQENTDIVLPIVEVTDHSKGTEIVIAEANVINPRPIEDIIVDINKCRTQIAKNYIKMSILLNEAKASVEHGDWSEWLNSNFQLSHETANRLMRIATEIPKSAALATLMNKIELPKTKVDILLRLNGDKLETFIADNKNKIQDLGTRSLGKLVKEFEEIETEELKKESETKAKDRKSAITADLHGEVDVLESCIDNLIKSFASNPSSKDVLDTAKRLQQLCSGIVEKYSVDDEIFRLNDEQV